MAAVKGPHISMPGRAFWGLVVQKGPWKSTYGDYLRAHEVPGGALGGGIQVGGTGEGKKDSVMTPHQMNGRNPLPELSEHATQSIVLPGESWFIKKSQPGSKRSSPLKTALSLAIKHSQDRDYEDISHAKDAEPNVPPVPVQTSSFLTETRLLESRERGKLSVVTNQEQTLPSPTMDIDTPSYAYDHGLIPTFIPPTEDLAVAYKKESESLKRKNEMDREDYEKKMKMMKGPQVPKIETGPTLPYARQSSTMPFQVKRLESRSAPKTYDEFPLNIKRKASQDDEPVKKGKLSKPFPPAIQTKNLSKYSNVGLLGGAAAPKEYDEVPNLLKRKQQNGAESERFKKGKLAPKQKSLKPSRITTTNLPPSKQSSTKPEGVRYENNSAPKKDDKLPQLRTRASKTRASKRKPQTRASKTRGKNV